MGLPFQHGMKQSLTGERSKEWKNILRNKKQEAMANLSTKAWTNPQQQFVTPGSWSYIGAAGGGGVGGIASGVITTMGVNTGDPLKAQTESHVTIKEVLRDINGLLSIVKSMTNEKEAATTT